MKNNVKLLTPLQYKNLKAKFDFDYDEENGLVLVKYQNGNRHRITKHPINETFSLNALRIRKITFGSDTLAIWKDLYKDNKIYLIDVQDAVNRLSIMLQPITKENVINMLEKLNSKK